MAKYHASHRLTWLILLAPESQTGGAAEREGKLQYPGLEVEEERIQCLLEVSLPKKIVCCHFLRLNTQAGNNHSVIICRCHLVLACWLQKEPETTTLPSSAAFIQLCLGGTDSQKPLSYLSDVEKATNKGIYQLKFTQSVTEIYCWMQYSLRAQQALPHD